MEFRIYFLLGTMPDHHHQRYIVLSFLFFMLLVKWHNGANAFTEKFPFWLLLNGRSECNARAIYESAI